MAKDSTLQAKRNVRKIHNTTFQTQTKDNDMGNINYHLPEYSKAIQISIEMDDM